MSLRKAQREAVRNALLREGMRLMSRQGFEATTVDQIAAAAGVAKGTFYNYFTSKEDLALAALVSLLARVEDELSQSRAQAGDLRGRLREMFSRLVAWTQDVNPELIWLWCIENLRRGVEEPASRIFHRLMTRLCAEAQQTGQLRTDRRPEDLALDLEGIVLARIAAWYHGGAPPGLMERLLAAVDTYLTGAAPAPASPSRQEKAMP
ncbi:MAG TPA: helix-turn-helix domain-containing protein [Thermaerobacter sp.]|nr:MAG: TetR/AcrR family transcriptional regulator [Bacillota bacterium]